LERYRRSTKKAPLTRSRFIARACTCLAVLTLGACVGEPVEWGDVAYRHSRLGDPDTRSAILSANLPMDTLAESPCLRSIRSVSVGQDVFRVWWALRGDSSAVLFAQHSIDGGNTWKDPVTVDARDRGRRVCDRPEPGVSYDRPHGYVYVVYFLEAADGAGIFFAHSMDNGATFHAPVPVVYGNRPSAASVAANGDSVVVVFEDPNATTPQIGIVLSHTTGHIFEGRGEATPDDVEAVRPWVALDHRSITVWWKKPARNSDGQTEDQVGFRVGVWK
jgi:hypothetical protein